MTKLGMFSYFSYPLPIEERFRLIKDAGFDATSLWWSGDNRHSQPDLARSIGLELDNVHAPFQNANVLWLPGSDGEDYLSILEGCVRDCKMHNIPTVVIHATGFYDEPAISEIGISRLHRLVTLAEDCGINLAFENLHTLEHLDHILKHFTSPYVGFCYDNGHELCNTPNAECLTKYGDKLVAIHLDDNLGDLDTHLLPFDGASNWEEIAEKLSGCRSIPYLTLEVDFNPKHTVSQIYQSLSAEQYCRQAYSAAVKFANLLY